MTTEKTIIPGLTTEIKYQAVKIACQKSLWTHIKVGMGYDFVPDEFRGMASWVQSVWSPIDAKRINALVQGHRDSFKSTIITQSLPSFLLAQDPNLAILLVSKVYSNAQSFLIAQKRRFEQEDFICVFGNWRDDKHWGEDKITIKQRYKIRKEPSIMVAGVSTEITGFHFDVIIGDDITTQADMYSKPEREQTAKVVKNCYDMVSKRTGLFLITGTCWNEDDELEKIKRDNTRKEKDKLLSFRTYIRPAEKQINGSWVPTGKHLSREVLDQIRSDKADIRDYSANYRLQPLPSEFQIFRELHFFDYTIDAVKAYKSIVLFVDPSLKGTDNADFSAIVSLGKRQDGRLECFRANLKQRKPSDLLDALVKEYDFIKGLNNNVTIYMETVMFQEYLKDQAINRALQGGRLLPIRGHDQKENKIMRITRIEKYTTSGQVLFRSDWKIAGNGYDILIYQLKNFPQGDHDDGPDALEGAVTNIMHSGENAVRFM